MGRLLLALAACALCHGAFADMLGPSPTVLNRSLAPPAVASYTGPGDLATWKSWFGLRAHSAAVAAPGTNVAVHIINLDPAGNDCDVLITTAGALGNVTGCTTGADNGKSLATFQTVDVTGSAVMSGTTLTITGGHIFDTVSGASIPPATFITGGSSPTWTTNKTLPGVTESITLSYGLRVTTLYDQSNIGGTQHNWTQSTQSKQALLMLSCYSAGTKACLAMSQGFSGYYSSTGTGGYFGGTPTTQAYVSFFSLPTSNVLFVNDDITSNWAFQSLLTSTSKPTTYAVVSGLVTVVSASSVTTGSCYGISGSYDGSNLRLYVNGAEDPASPTALTGSLRSAGNEWTFGNDNNGTSGPFIGFSSEGGVAGAAFSGATQTLIYANQFAYWGC